MNEPVNPYWIVRKHAYREATVISGLIRNRENMNVGVESGILFEYKNIAYIPHGNDYPQ